MVDSLVFVAKHKYDAAISLAEEFYLAKISLLYDSLRTYLEVVALAEGYKVLNHECYRSFIEEILHEQQRAKEFNDMRKVRNAINYYGHQVEEADEVQHKLISLISLVKTLF